MLPRGDFAPGGSLPYERACAAASPTSRKLFSMLGRCLVACIFRRDARDDQTQVLILVWHDVPFTRLPSLAMTAFSARLCMHMQFASFQETRMLACLT
ncbi:hypothetical protein BD309DRAFT_858542 [Dichomitus squalens]|uniref:Uncharacterized protein n=1 Tax=Dichomitus squalens TaxID=114155 RepID=A0A4V2K4X6_9APHY|nr:hypothetical protein BD309DRAFT_858542 [Dichomitus squalens]TBU57375.1 hypothetical protein BD310DRAFT_821764 [Dichomitus squalens]